MTQDSRLLRWKSPTMVGRAVATMVWSSAARNMPIMSPDMITRICRCVKAGPSGELTVGVAGELTGPVLSVIYGQHVGTGLARATRPRPGGGDDGARRRNSRRRLPETGNPLTS